MTLSTSTERCAPGRWVLLAVLVIVGACYAPVAENGMSPEDDAYTICFQERLNPPRFTADGVGWYWTHSQLDLYAPLTQMMWAVLAKATYVPTADPQTGIHVDLRFFHLANLAWFLVAVGLVFSLLQYLLICVGTAGTRATWSAAGGALIYGLHPLQVEAVAWLSGTKDVMFAAASVGSVLAYLRAVGPEIPGRPSSRGGRRAAYVAGLLLVPIGMLCKPTAMVAPVIAIVLDLIILRRPIRRVVIAALPYVIAAVPLAVVAKLAQPAAGVPLPPLLQRPAVAGASAAFYVYKLVWPVNLTFDYALRPDQFAAQLKTQIVGCATIAILGALCWFSLWRRRWPWVAAAIGMFVVALLPVLGFVPFTFQFFSTVSDHYMVLPMLAVGMLVARSLAALRRPAVPVGVAVVCVAAAVAGVLVVRQIQFWSTPDRISRHMVEAAPNSALGHNARGEWLQQQGELRAAVFEFKTAARANDRFFAPVVALAKIYAMVGQPEAAMQAVKELVRIRNRFPAGAKPDFSHFISDVLVPKAQAFHHDADVSFYRAQEQRLFGEQRAAGE